MSKRAKSTMGQASSSREEIMEKKVFKFGLFNNGNHQMNYNNLAGRSIHSEDVVDWEFLSNKGESRDVATLSGLRNVETVNATRLTHSFWPSIGDGMFNEGNKKAQSIRNPRIKLAHRCITMTITGRKETTNRVTKIDLFYLYCIFGDGFVCNIPYWLTKYLKIVKDKSVIFEGMFVTRITRSFGLLTNEMVSVLNCYPPPHVYRKTSLVKMGVIMELHEGEYCWPATRGVMKESKGDDEEGNGEGRNRGVGGSVNIYRNMSQGDYHVCQERWMD
nr:hypothetical protein [Tanacetum cinerariifolium]